MTQKTTGGQVEIVSEFGRVYLYTHEHVDMLISAVHDTLARRTRWDDPDYLSRMIFCRMVPGDELYEEVGYGIGPAAYADVDVLVTVDCTHQTVYVHAMSDPRHGKLLSFTDFVENFTRSAEL
jgi:hypothetical protein